MLLYLTYNLEIEEIKKQYREADETQKSGLKRVYSKLTTLLKLESSKVDETQSLIDQMIEKINDVGKEIQDYQNEIESLRQRSSISESLVDIRKKRRLISY